MALFLQAVGLAFLLFLLLIVVGFLVIRAKIRKFINNAAEQVATIAAAAAAATPARIHLSPVSEPEWADEARVKELAEPLPSLGFASAGVYTVDEIGGLTIDAWVNPRESVTAAVYEHPQGGAWVDLFTHFEDGTRITYNNSSTGEGVEHAPGHEVQRYPELGTRELYEKFMAERPQKPARVIDAGNFVAVFEKVYAEEMDWRNSRGDAALGELKALAAKQGIGIETPEFEQLRQFQQRQAAEGLNEAVRERFLQQSSLSAAQWEEVRDRLLVIHDRLTPEMLDEMVSGWVEDGFGAPPSPPPDYSIRRAFEEFNATLPHDQRFVRLGEVKEPVEAEVYSAPAG